jgi:hypothetical protein
MTLRQKLTLLFTAFLLTLLLGFGLLLEVVGLVFSTYPQAYPIALILGIAIAYPQLRNRSSRPIALTLLTLYGCFILSLNFANFYIQGPVRPFVSFYRDIHPGMSQNQVQQSLDKHFPSHGNFPKPRCRDRSILQNKIELSCQLDPNQSAYNAEFITVHFIDDRMTYKNYSPD